MPPPTAMYIRAPRLTWPNESTSPACTANDDHGSRGSPFTRGSSSAPVTATTPGSPNRSSGPM